MILQRGRACTPHSRLVFGLVAASVTLGMCISARSQLSGSWIQFVVTGDTRSYLEPCGCQPDSPGGLARRATILRPLIENGATYIELGNQIGPQPALGVDFPFVLQEIQHLGCVVVGLGANDLAEARARPQGESTMLCTNWHPDKPQPNVLQTQMLSVAGRRIAFVNFLDAGKVPAGGQTEDPAMEWMERRDALRRTADFTIVLSNLRERDPNRLARLFSGAGLIISTTTSLSVPSITHPSGVWVAATPTLARGVLSLRLRFASSGQFETADAVLIPLGPTVPSDPAVAQRVLQHIRSRGRIALGVETGAGAEALQQFAAKQVGVQVGCAGCHPRQTRDWAGTKHAHAWQALTERGQDSNVACAACHTTPVIAPPPGPGLTGVGCATCHGVGDGHQADPKRSPLARMPRESLCRSCHTPEQDPGFLFPLKLANVKHRSMPSRKTR